MTDTAHPVPHPLSRTLSDLDDPFHRPRQHTNAVCASTPTSASQLRPALLSALASRFVAAVGVRPRYTVSIIEKSSA